MQEFDNTNPNLIKSNNIDQVLGNSQRENESDIKNYPP